MVTWGPPRSARVWIDVRTVRRDPGNTAGGMHLMCWRQLPQVRAVKLAVRVFWPVFTLAAPVFTITNYLGKFQGAGLVPGWCGNGQTLVPKSIGVGLDQVGGDWRRF